MRDNKILMVIDGNSLMHRAFYAIPPLSTKKGIYTNAVYGFMNMLFKLIEEYHPEYIGVAFDRKAPTFRHKEYKEYKGTRQKTPEILVPQFDTLKKLLSAMNIAIYERDGYEADDILGTFARIAGEKGMKAYLVTGDRDALQLIDENVNVLMTKKGITDIRIYDEKALHEDYGITPAQVIEMKSLMGDSSDNIPGVPGVGKKTAFKLINKYGTLENVYAHIDEISGKKLKENLEKYKAQAFLSKRLATIIKDAPVDISIADCCYDIPNSLELKELLMELEFSSILSRLDFDMKSESEKPDIKRPKTVINIEDASSLKDVLSSIKAGDTIALLVEDDGLSIASNKDRVYMVPITHNLIDMGLNYNEVMDILKSILEDRDVKKITHDAKKLMVKLSKEGICLDGVYFDTFIAAYLIESTKEKYDMAQLMYDYTGLNIDRVDASDILILYTAMKHILKEHDMFTLYEQVEHPLITVLAQMEIEGFKVDKNILRELDKEFTESLNTLTSEIYDLAGEEFNINSPKQLGVILFEKLDLPVIKRTKTGYSTNIEVLEQLQGQHPIIDKVMDYRQIMKLKSTYVDGLLAVIDPEDGRIHSSFNQTVTATGRISSTEPNLQNIPVKVELGRQIRRVFVASSDDHVLLDADYSQIELRVLAHISEDPTFIEAFKNNQDIHARTASEIFNVSIDEVTPEQRGSAKAVNFGIVYGISDFGLARNLNISRNQAKTYIESYFARYPMVKEYMDNVVHEAKLKGYVTTLMGRRRNLPELNSRNFNIRSFGERVAMNTPIQGTAADIIKVAMNRVFYELKKRQLKSKLILQVHDELIVDTHKSELDEVRDIVKTEMQNAMELRVPLVVDIGVGYSWYDAK
ncbi:DNA polymerase I [Xylanivirga thermophila]|uniref:DNA polymerase I n=1 Tax=Xylanivirga thermophila TaxID=2496273 RepID=UPI00101BB13D|nr:DNA polymerase I [Xylanivirga thermophila]